MTIHFNATKIKGKKYKSRILKKISQIIDKGIFLYGKENRQLASNLRNFLGSGYLVPTASGHEAILLALQSLKLDSTAKIIFPVNAYPTAFPIIQSGAKLVPVDVDKNGLIDPCEVAKKISKNTRGIVVVHLYGLVANLGAIKRLVSDRRITIVEDCAQAFGSKIQGRLVGTIGDFGCFSFYPTKNLGTFGDGGAIWTKNKRLYHYLTQAVSYGEKERYKSKFVSGHSRLPEIQAGVLNLYLKNLEKELTLRKKVFQRYQKLTSRYKLKEFLRILYNEKSSAPVLHQLVVQVKERDELRKYLWEKGIETHIHYPLPVHLIKAFSFLGYKKGSFPVAEELSKTILSLPFHPYLPKNQIEYIVKSVRDFYYD